MLLVQSSHRRVRVGVQVDDEIEYEGLRVRVGGRGVNGANRFLDLNY